jgi:hypothetical protein
VCYTQSKRQVRVLGLSDEEFHLVTELTLPYARRSYFLHQLVAELGTAGGPHIPGSEWSGNGCNSGFWGCRLSVLTITTELHGAFCRFCTAAI